MELLETIYPAFLQCQHLISKVMDTWPNTVILGTPQMCLTYIHKLLSQTPALASYACICLPTVGGGGSAGQLLPILLFLGVHLYPPNCKVTEVSQHCKNSLITHSAHIT